MGMTVAAKMKRLKSRRDALQKQCAECPHCQPDHKYYGPGWVYHGDNGPIAPCPLCNPDGKHPRKM